MPATAGSGSERSGLARAEVFEFADEVFKAGHSMAAGA